MLSWHSAHLYGWLQRELRLEMEVMAEFVYQADVPTVSFILNFAFRRESVAVFR